MALARIITRSHQYAQQLALDLLARGYTVEIVSPEAIPANPADLELRVEAAATEVQGQVTDIREQGKSKSIEYLQRLKPIMADLLRRRPADSEAKQAGSEFNFNAEAECSEDMELPLDEYQRQSEAAQKRPQEPQIAESARLVSSVSRVKTQKPACTESSIFSITGEPISWDESEPERSGNSEVWFWRAALGFAGMALLILVLGMALRKTPSLPAQAAAPPATQTVAATQPPLAVPKPSPASVSQLPSKAAVVPTAAPIAAARAKPSPALRTRAGQNNGVNGDTTVTYFNTKATEPPKPAASQMSGIKHYSDMD